MVHIAVRIVDGQGSVVPLADNEVTFELEGSGKLIGTDNGNMRDLEDYCSKRRKAFYGLCLALVQAAADPGEIRLTAASPGLEPATAVIIAN